MILLRLLVTILTILALPFFVAGISVTTTLTAVIVAVVLVFLNDVVKPILTLLTLPLNFLTLGLFSVILNGAFFWFAAQIITGFTVASFTAAIIGAFIVSVITWIINRFID